LSLAVVKLNYFPGVAVVPTDGGGAIGCIFAVVIFAARNARLFFGGKGPIVAAHRDPSLDCPHCAARVLVGLDVTTADADNHVTTALRG